MGIAELCSGNIMEAVELLCRMYLTSLLQEAGKRRKDTFSDTDFWPPPAYKCCVPTSVQHTASHAVPMVWWSGIHRDYKPSAPHLKNTGLSPVQQNYLRLVQPAYSGQAGQLCGLLQNYGPSSFLSLPTHFWILSQHLPKLWNYSSDRCLQRLCKEEGVRRCYLHPHVCTYLVYSFALYASFVFQLLYNCMIFIITRVILLTQLR